MQTPEDSFWSVLGRVQVRIDFNPHRNDFNINPYEHICRLQRTASGVCWGERDDDRLRRKIPSIYLISISRCVFFINNTTIVFVARRRRIYLMEMMLIKNHMAIFADSK